MVNEFAWGIRKGYSYGVFVWGIRMGYLYGVSPLSANYN